MGLVKFYLKILGAFYCRLSFFRTMRTIRPTANPAADGTAPNAKPKKSKSPNAANAVRLSAAPKRTGRKYPTTLFFMVATSEQTKPVSGIARYIANREKPISSPGDRKNRAKTTHAADICGEV